MPGLTARCVGCRAPVIMPRCGRFFGHAEVVMCLVQNLLLLHDAEESGFPQAKYEQVAIEVTPSPGRRQEADRQARTTSWCSR